MDCPRLLEQALQQRLPRARLSITHLPQVPEMALWLIDDEIMQGPLTPEEMHAAMHAPTYWAFCWASGQVLARYILDQQIDLHGKTVLDFGTGSGVVAIAAAMAGAKTVIACDIDPESLASVTANAQLNRIDNIILSDDFFTLDITPDVIIAADVLYDRENYPWLQHLRDAAPEVLVADSRVKHFPCDSYRCIGQFESCTVPDLKESLEFNQVRLFHLK